MFTLLMIILKGIMKKQYYIHNYFYLRTFWYTEFELECDESFCPKHFLQQKTMLSSIPCSLFHLPGCPGLPWASLSSLLTPPAPFWEHFLGQGFSLLPSSGNSEPDFAGPDWRGCQPGVLPECVGFLFLKQCNSSLLSLSLGFFSRYLRCSQATVGLVMHLLQQSYFLLVQYQTIWTKTPFRDNHRAFLIFLAPKLFLWRSLCIQTTYISIL